MKAHHIILCLLLFSCNSPTWAAKDGGLVLTVVFTEQEAGGTRSDIALGDGPLRYDFFAKLHNTSDAPVIVPRGRPEPIFLEETKNGRVNFTVLCVWDIVSFEPGVLEIPAESELGLVKLLSGESTRLHVAFREYRRIPEGSVTFGYSVGKSLAARFKTWEGDLRVPALSQREARILQGQKHKEAPTGK